MMNRKRNAGGVEGWLRMIYVTMLFHGCPCETVLLPVAPKMPKVLGAKATMVFLEFEFSF